MATATKALALDETLQDVVTELRNIATAVTATELNDLQDVNISAPTNGEVLIFNSSSDKWKNETLAAAPIARKADISSIFATGATNTTGAKIPNGAFFYLNGILCRALADIATNATFTRNTNYKETALGDETGKSTIGTFVNISNYTDTNRYTCPTDGYVVGLSGAGVTSGQIGYVIYGSNNVGVMTRWFTILQQYQADGTFVRAGMQVGVKGLPAGCYLRFYPFE